MRSFPDSHALLTVPNLITLTRILLTPLFIICLLQGRYAESFWVFVLAGLTDMADGLVARRWGQKSPLGTYLDPLADKLLLSSSFITLSLYYLIPPWLTVVVLSRDLVLILGVVVFRLANFPLLIRPTLAGKLSAALQMATVLFVLLGKFLVLPQAFLGVWFWITAGLTSFSGIHYILRALRDATQSQNRQG